MRRKVSEPGEGLAGSQAPWKDTSGIAATFMASIGLIAWTKEYSPTLLLFGGSYLGGFLLGWISRRFIKTAILITGGFILLLSGLKSTGWITLDWVSIEASITQALSVFQTEAEGMKQMLKGFLPSAGAVSAGLFFGSRKIKCRPIQRPEHE